MLLSLSNWNLAGAHLSSPLHIHTHLPTPQVEFFAPWAPACVHLEPVVAALSLVYTTDRLRFAKVDASRCVCVCGSSGGAGAEVEAVG